VFVLVLKTNIKIDKAQQSCQEKMKTIIKFFFLGAAQVLDVAVAL